MIWKMAGLLVNWFGLDGLTRTIQVQRIRSSKLAPPSVGGTINIITKELILRRRKNKTKQVMEIP